MYVSFGLFRDTATISQVVGDWRGFGIKRLLHYRGTIGPFGWRDCGEPQGSRFHLALHHPARYERVFRDSLIGTVYPLHDPIIVIIGYESKCYALVSSL
jgi:hypothetical protein